MVEHIAAMKQERDGSVNSCPKNNESVIRWYENSYHDKQLNGLLPSMDTEMFVVSQPTLHLLYR